jgi:hypothetical protein
MVSPDTRKTRYIIVTPVVALAVAVLLLSLPRLQASYRYLPVDIAIQRYFETRELASDRLPVLMGFAEQALEHQDHYRYHDGLSLLHLLRALDINTLALERRGEYLAASNEAMASLQRAPAQPAVWFRLANIRWILHEEPETIIAAWKMSIFTGRTDSTLFSPRVELGLAHRDNMDEEGIAMLRDQLLLTWRLQPGGLIRILSVRDPGLSATRRLIANTDPVALQEMEAWLEKLR